jgi:hypothetical protein
VYGQEDGRYRPAATTTNLPGNLPMLPIAPI